MRLPKETVDRLRPAFDAKTVCVTGGCGFIGGHLCDALHSLGAAVRVIDDCSSSSSEHVCSLIDLDPERLRFVRASILDPQGLAEAVRGSDAVFHLAAIGSVPRSIEDPARSWAVNATGTLRVLEAARAFGVRRVVYSASSSAYGESETLPKVESMPADPVSPYAASKLAGEELCRVWSRCYGLSTACLRYFNVFGPRQPAGSAYAAVIPAVLEKLGKGQSPVIHGDGEQTRDFTPVANAVLANLLAASSTTPLTGEAMNVGLGVRVSINQLVRRLASMMDAEGLEPVHADSRAGDVRHSLADLSRAGELIGYAPVTGFDEGLAETVEWARGGAVNNLGGSR
ncbi:MAG: NAD-dependent epimerase/dehydratase family protein [Phycisphaerales bacterium JB040]